MTAEKAWKLTRSAFEFFTPEGRFNDRQQAQAVVAATLAVGRVAPKGPEERQVWLSQVAELAAALGPIVKAVRLDLMRTIKEMPVEGILEVARVQNHANRINYTVNSGGKYTDSLWSEWLEGDALEAERRRLMGLHGLRGRLVKVPQVDFDHDGNPSETLLHAKQDRLENWRLLQELAGLR